MKMRSRLTPRPTNTSRQAIAAAPAPDTAILTAPMSLPTSSRPLSSAAALMIAVPCWSSWNTGMFMRSRSLRLDREALRRLDVFEVDAAQRRLERGDDVDQLVGVLLGQLDVEHVDAGELLEQAALALHHRLAGQRADVAQAQHRGAVGDHAHQVGAAGVLGGERRVVGDRQAGIGHAGRIGERQVALVRQRLGRRDRDLAAHRLAVIVERGLAQRLLGGAQLLVATCGLSHDGLLGIGAERLPLNGAAFDPHPQPRRLRPMMHAPPGEPRPAAS